MKTIKSLMGAGVCLASILAITPAEAAVTHQNSWYWGISGDATWLSHSDLGWGGNVQAGYQFNDFRLEGQVGYHAADGDTGYTNTHYFTYMGNAYYDFNSSMLSSGGKWNISPYIGAGAGAAGVRYGHSTLTGTLHNNNSSFAYQGMAGLNFVSASMPNTDVNLGYRYLGTSNHNLHASNVELGVRFHF